MKKQDTNMGNFPNSRNVPKLRFPGFYDKWEERYISEVISSKSKKYNPENSDSNYPSIELESLSQDSGELLSTFDSKNQKSIKNVFNTGDVLFGKLRPYLKKYYLADFDGVCSSEIWVLKSSILDSSYLYAFVQSNSFISLTEISSGSKMPRADWNLVSSSSIVYPSNPDERQKIGILIQLINSRIQTQKKIIEDLRLLKKNITKKIFNQQIKFKNTNQEEFSNWELTSLENILIKYEEKSTYSNQYPILTSARTGIYFQKDYFDDNEVASKDNTGYNVVPKGYFTYRHMSDDTIFKFNINDICDKGIVSTLYPVFTTTGVNNYFLKEYLNEGQEFKNYALLQKQGGSRTYMYFNKLSRLMLYFPPIDEQNKIAEFLKILDDKINLENDLLTKYENQKKYLLQNLFV